MAFGPKPTRNYKLKTNTKVTFLALTSALAQKIDEQAVYFLEEKVKLDKPSTKTIVKLLDELQLTSKKTLFILSKEAFNMIKSAQNLPKTIAKV